MSFAEWVTMQRELLDELQVEQDISILVNNGTGFDRYDNVKAVVTMYKQEELVPDRTIKLGDTKILVPADQWPAAITRDLEGKDRIELKGQAHSVIHFNPNTKSVQGLTVMYEVGAR